MAVTLIPKKRNIMEQLFGDFGSLFEYTGFFALSGGFFVIVLFAWVGLWGYGTYLQDSLEQANKTALSIQEQRDLAEETEVARFALHVQEVKKLLENRLTVAPLFQFLEHRTHADVILRSIELSVTGRTLEVSADTNGYVSLAEQIVLWENDPNVEGVRASNFAVGNDGRLSFSASIMLSQTILRETE
jgi:hypothetical protein